MVGDVPVKIALVHAVDRKQQDMLLHLGGMCGCHSAHERRQRREDGGGGESSGLTNAAAIHMSCSMGATGTIGSDKENGRQTSSQTTQSTTQADQRSRFLIRR